MQKRNLNGELISTQHLPHVVVKMMNNMNHPSDIMAHASIHCLYMNVCGAPPPTEWNKLGTIVEIEKRLGPIVSGGHARVKSVITEIWDCIASKVAWEPNMKNDRGGHNILIKFPSVESEMIADIKEQGLSLKVAMNEINLYREKTGLVHVGWSAVRSAYHRMNPVVTRILRCCQGSTDPDSRWAKARLPWVTQLAVRFGILKLDDCTPEEKVYCSGMDTLHFAQVMHWDETHKKILMGLTGKGKTLQTRFRRNAEGKVDLKFGTLAKRKSYLQAKYTEETRLEVGAGVVMLLDGSLRG